MLPKRVRRALLGAGYSPMQGLCWPARSTHSPRGWHANNNPRLKICSTARGALQLQPCLCSFYHNASAPRDKASPTCNRPLCTEERPGSIIPVHSHGQEHGDCRNLSSSVTERAWRTEQRDRGQHTLWGCLQEGDARRRNKPDRVDLSMPAPNTELSPLYKG